ncbi:helix-turn-helix domain-containing protein [Clostridium estertheticum]|uniref:helix-turn-helix domain-containing protein n=1 Tax=Clostridium estertheticum TaxID=238834 RepID=UPI001CF23E31|nr:helix-turn-helix domain-containing protein [Clostridium estertheticum]MCB2356893.1 helix-turn-helix domain-containing protein [Clostridium estertheticum]WAG44012.1 helix-turn-helix domain-containing protein [Clostridium estertheticum]
MLAEKIHIDALSEIIRKLTIVPIDDVVNSSEVSQAQMQINLLHENDDGYITIALKKDNNWIQHHYKVDELKENIGKLICVKDANIYLSPNSFYKPKRRIENIRKLNSLFIDLDYYTLEQYKGLSAEQIIWLLEKDYFKQSVPPPSFIVISGQGIVIYWLIEPVPYMALPLWNAVQKFFLEKLKEIGADAKSIDAARVSRLSGTINQKNGQATEILVFNEERYSLRDIQENYLPELNDYVKNPSVKKRGRKSKVVKLYNLYSLHHARLMDIVEIQNFRKGYCRDENGELVEKSQRELMCFLYRYWACCFTNDLKKALEDTLEFNKGFICPLPESEVRSQTSQAERAYKEWLENEFENKEKKDVEQLKIEIKDGNDKKKNRSGYKYKGYNYKNTTLIGLLNIVEDEMKVLKTIINTKEIKRRDNNQSKVRQKAKYRNEDGLTKRQQSKLEKVKVIKELKVQGLTCREIAARVQVNLSTVSRYLKE